MPPLDPPSREDFAAHPHDSLVQRFLTRPEVAAIQLRVALPPALTAHFDWPTLRIASGTYIDPKLRPRRGDILYAVDLLDTHRPAFIYVLLEHQSTSQRLMAFRLLQYACRLWERYVHAQPTPVEWLPLVIPLVLYQGPGGWTAPRRLSELLDVPPALLAACPSPIELAFGPESPLRDILYETASPETREVFTSYRDHDRAEARAEGEAKGMAAMLLRLLDQRGLPLPLELAHQVSHCQDPAQLQRWFDRAVQAARIEDVFAD